MPVIKRVGKDKRPTRQFSGKRFHWYWHPN